MRRSGSLRIAMKSQSGAVHHRGTEKEDETVRMAGLCRIRQIVGSQREWRDVQKLHAQRQKGTPKNQKKPGRGKTPETDPKQEGLPPISEALPRHCKLLAKEMGRGWKEEEITMEKYLCLSKKRRGRTRIEKNVQQKRQEELNRRKRKKKDGHLVGVAELGKTGVRI